LKGEFARVEFHFGANFRHVALELLEFLGDGLASRHLGIACFMA
jgi:hypothetical protein